MNEDKQRPYDLEDRLLDDGARIIRLTRSLNDETDQLIRIFVTSITTAEKRKVS